MYVYTYYTFAKHVACLSGVIRRSSNTILERTDNTLCLKSMPQEELVVQLFLKRHISELLRSLFNIIDISDLYIELLLVKNEPPPTLVLRLGGPIGNWVLVMAV